MQTEACVSRAHTPPIHILLLLVVKTCCLTTLQSQIPSQHAAREEAGVSPHMVNGIKNLKQEACTGDWRARDREPNSTYHLAPPG